MCGAVAAVEENLKKKDLEQTECGEKAKNEMFVKLVVLAWWFLDVIWWYSKVWAGIYVVEMKLFTQQSLANRPLLGVGVIWQMCEYQNFAWHKMTCHFYHKIWFNMYGTEVTLILGYLFPITF